MEFKISDDVLEKFRDIFVAIPVIYGFNNTPTEDNLELVAGLKVEAEEELREQFKSVDELAGHEYVKVYFDAFTKLSATPKKTPPTHIALAKRVIEGVHLPSINPIVDTYNAFSIKHITPFGGEDLDKVYGDFRLTIATGDEHWIGIGDKEPKS